MRYCIHLYYNKEIRILCFESVQSKQGVQKHTLKERMRSEQGRKLIGSIGQDIKV